MSTELYNTVRWIVLGTDEKGPKSAQNSQSWSMGRVVVVLYDTDNTIFTIETEIYRRQLW
jgi:hypothetical protein